MKMGPVKFGEKAALLLFLCYLRITSPMNEADAACLEGFAALQGSEDELGEGQFIIPSLEFKCDGNITQVMFVASGEGNARLQFQAWKPLPPNAQSDRVTAYSLATAVDVSRRFTSSDQTTITAALASPLAVSANDVLGVYVSDTGSVRLFTTEERGFTMFSHGVTGQTLAISDLATSTSISVFVSVGFEMVSSASPTAEMALSSPPAGEMVPSASPASEMFPSSSPAPEMVPSSSPAPEMAPSSSPAPEMAPSSSPAPEMAPSSSPAPEMDPSSSPAGEMAPSSSPAPETVPSSPAANELSQSTTSSSDADGSSSTAVASDSSASQAGPSSVLAGTIVGVMLGVCALVVAMVMGVICFGVFYSRRSAKSRLEHSGYTSAAFRKESGTVLLLKTSSVPEPLLYEEPDLNHAPEEADFPVPSYELIAWQQDGMGNLWFANPIAKDGPAHMYEAVDSHQEPAQAFPIYGYVPTMDARRGQVTATDITQIQQNHIYAEIEAIYEGVVSVDQAEQPYSLPPDGLGQLYDYLAEKKCIEIPRNAIRREVALGAGEFGEVFKGVLDTPYGPQEVAAKMLKAGSDDKEKAKFLQEAAIMAQFSHPHVVRLVGAVTVDDPCVLVLEFLPKGDLRKYLIAQRPEPGNLPEDALPAKLLSFCQEIANGMKYLSNKGFIHRDLAARNILLDKNLKCRIADFGMSKNVESAYYMSMGRKVPIRWTAPECLFHKKYCAGSDVWSYGMLLFEIWSLGHPPFPELTPMQVVEKLRNSKTYVQPPPPGCPRHIYKLMVHCWNYDHHNRPSVHSVTGVLSSPAKPLSVPQEELQDIPDSIRATQLGAPMEYGKQLYADLQQYYNTN